MTAKIKSYFLAPSWDYQKDGPLALGNIISDPADPVFSQLSSFETVEELARPKIHHNPPESWSHATNHFRSHEFHIFAHFLDSLGIGPGAGVLTTSNLQRQGSYIMDSLQTSYFVPEPPYILSRLMDPAVSLFLGSRKFFQSKTLYIVTGVKTAKGLRVRTANSRSTAVGADVGSSLTPIGVPVSSGLGKKVDWSQTDETNVGKDCPDIEVVFAYQLRRITVKGQTGHQTVQNKPFNKAAFLSSENGKVNAVSDASELFDLDSFDIDSRDVRITDLEEMGSELDRNALREQDTFVDGEPCKLVFHLSPS